MEPIKEGSSRIGQVVNGVEDKVAKNRRHKETTKSGSKICTSLRTSRTTYIISLKLVRVSQGADRISTGNTKWTHSAQPIFQLLRAATRSSPPLHRDREVQILNFPKRRSQGQGKILKGRSTDQKFSLPKMGRISNLLTL
jgi:hypothetical protein